MQSWWVVKPGGSLPVFLSFFQFLSLSFDLHRGKPKVMPCKKHFFLFLNDFVFGHNIDKKL